MVLRLPDLSGSIPSTEDVGRNPHLADIKLPVVAEASKAQLIVGMSSPNLHVFSEINQNGKFRLWVDKSPLGWVLHGRDFATFRNSRHSINLSIDSKAVSASDA